MTVRCLVLLLFAGGVLAQAPRPDGLYAVMETSKGRIVARLEFELVPMTVANFVGLAEGTIANAAFDPGRPYFDGSLYHRVVLGHVIQTGIPQSERAKNPGYAFPNEIHARLSHNRAGVLNMANSGPNTSASQFCITLGDRSYLDGDFNVFGEVVEGLDVVMKIVQGDQLRTVRIERVGARTQAFHPATESFRAMVSAAEKQVAEDAKKKLEAEREWVAQHYPHATGPKDGVLTETIVQGPAGTGPVRLRYSGVEVRYRGNVIGRTGPPLETIAFQSGENGMPGFFENPRLFPFLPGQTKVGPGGALNAVLASMKPGERRIAVIPAALGYGRAGLYPPEIPGYKRFVISPNALLVYDLELVAEPWRR